MRRVMEAVIVVIGLLLAMASAMAAMMGGQQALRQGSHTSAAGSAPVRPRAAPW
jgi:hypothetical protein